MAGLLQLSRRFGTSKLLLESLSEPLKADHAAVDHSGSADTWKKLFFFVCCPAMGVAFLNVSLSEEPERPEFKKYPHMRIRHKQYPWRDGVKTLFHNPHRNALPDGYEDAHH